MILFIYFIIVCVYLYMHMYNFLCSDSLLYFFLFLSTLHSVYTRDCPESTRRDTTYCVRIWKEWCKHRQDTSSCNITPLSAITASELQYWLTRFITEVRNKNGVEYPPNTLLHICTGIIRYLRNNGHPSMEICKD